MRIGNAGSSDINVLLSDAVTKRGGDKQVDDGYCFFRAMSLTSAAAEEAHGQLLNPASSGIVIYLDTIWIGQTVSGRVDLRTHDTALSNLNTPAYNKVLWGTDGVGEVREESLAASAGNIIIVLNVRANAPGIFPIDKPIRLDEGKGLVVRQSVQNQTLNVGFNWREYSL